MKKTLLFTLGMVLSLTAGMTVSQAIVMDDGDSLLSQIFEQAGMTRQETQDAEQLKTLASQSDAPFAGLYLFMLENIKDGPQDAAIAEIAKRYKYTEDEIKSIVLTGDTTGIINKRKADFAAAQSAESSAQMEEAGTEGDADLETFISENDFGDQTEAYIRWYYQEYEEAPLPAELSKPLTSDFLLNEYAKITDAYDHELEFQQTNRRLSYEALASEMFMNNNLDDSANVDLLYDLDLIHYLLFGDLITYPDRSGDDVDLASEEEPLDLFTVPEPNHVVVELASDSIDPYVCYGDEDLASALDAYDANPPDTGDALPETSSDTEIDYSIDDEADAVDGASPDSAPEETSTPDSSSGDAEDTGSSSSSDAPNPYLVDIGAAFQSLDDFLSSLEAPTGDWSREYACSEIFCIEVKVIAENDDAEVEDSSMEAADFDEDENCIACHTAYIKERLEETMSKSLVPSKISMNWFEDATCKEAGSLINLDLNVYAIKKPIDLDPGDDLDEKPNKDIENFKTTLNGLAAFPLGKSDGSDASTNLGKSKNEEECQSIFNLTKAAKTERSIDELLEDCQAVVTNNAAQIQEVFDEFKFNTYSQTTSDLYGQVSAELYTMLLYFQTFQEDIKKTYEEGDAPLASLLTKKYCE